MRRHLLGLGSPVAIGAACTLPAHCPPVPSSTTAAPLASDYTRDFAQFAKEVGEGYVYFAENQVDWNVLFIATTNRLDRVDEAAIRAGRVDSISRCRCGQQRMASGAQRRDN